MKKYLIFTGIILILFIIAVPNCQLPLEEEGSGNVIIETPSKINPAMKSVFEGTGTIVDSDTLDQNRFRYDLIIDDARTGKRIAIKHLFRNEKTVITVPSGRSLNFYVGVYYATSSRSYYETYNVYLASDKITNVRIMPGETQHLEFVLDVNRGLKADSYFLDTLALFGGQKIVNITGGVNSSSNLPVFSLDPLSGTLTTSYMITFNNSMSPSPVSPPSGIGRVFRVKNDPGGVYWFLSNNSSAVNKSGDGITWGGTSAPAYNNVNLIRSLIPKLKFAKSVYVASASERYYFFSYGDGYLCANFDSLGSWGDGLKRIDFSYLKSLYPYEDFLLDVEQDSGSDDNYTFFASKIGLFYIEHTTLKKFTREDGKQDGINDLKKVIRITNPNDPRMRVLIRKVRVIGNKIFLGTRQGVYYINKTSSAWNSFQSASTLRYKLFPQDQIHKMKDFYDEPVISMDQYTINSDEILVITTPRRIWFYNATNGKEKMITVWDGLPFTPIQRFRNAPDLNTLDFMRHEVAPIKFVLWNDTSGIERFFIGTDYGLASIEYNDIF